MSEINLNSIPIKDSDSLSLEDKSIKSFDSEIFFKHSIEEVKNEVGKKIYKMVMFGETEV